MTAEQFFERFPHSLALYTSVEKALKALGPYRMRVSKSQIAFLADKPFAYVWIPERYQRGNTAPLVLSLPLSFRDETVLWKRKSIRYARAPICITKSCGQLKILIRSLWLCLHKTIRK